MKKVIGIASSDWHLWHTPPVWRSEEPNWLEAMDRQLYQVLKAAVQNHCPVFMGGDIFDRYNPVPETINFLLDRIPEGLEIYAVPGQHDLEHHILTLESLQKTGFEIVRERGIISPIFDYYKNRFNHKYKADDRVTLYFAPWGTKLEEIEVEEATEGVIQILIAHKYVWFDDSTRYGGQEIPSGKLSGLKEVLQKFDFAVFGDNHIPFTFKIGKCNVINPGTLCKRKVDEKDYKTGYAILYSDKTYEFVEFDTSEDKYLDIKVEDTPSIDFSSSEFLQQLQSMETNQIDFQMEIEKKLETMNRPDMEHEFRDIFNNYGEHKK